MAGRGDCRSRSPNRHRAYWIKSESGDQRKPFFWGAWDSLEPYHNSPLWTEKLTRPGMFKFHVTHRLVEFKDRPTPKYPTAFGPSATAVGSALSGLIRGISSRRSQ
eukprot:7767720-Pyramimonas_sp.AAC.1